jgi:hypothetical protein
VRLYPKVDSSWSMRLVSMSENAANEGTITFRSKLIFGMAIPEKRRVTKAHGHPLQGALFSNGSKRGKRHAPALPPEDNTPEGLRAIMAANAHYREVAWPEPYHRTTHRLHLGDARDLSWIWDASVHLVVTSPPYWTLKKYTPDNGAQMGHFEDYEHFLSQLDRVWSECEVRRQN